MAATRATVRKTLKPASPGNILVQFTWEGIDKRGIRMKGEEVAKSESALKVELRRRGISNPTVREVKKPFFGAAGKKITGQDIAVCGGASLPS